MCAGRYGGEGIYESKIHHICRSAFAMGHDSSILHFSWQLLVIWFCVLCECSSMLVWWWWWWGHDENKS